MKDKIEVLYVEDDERSRQTVQRFLTGHGFHVTAVPDAEAGSAALGERPFSVVISDLRLPARDGIEFIREVKSRRPAVPCILVTAHGEVQSAVRAMKAGAFQFIEKPIVPSELVALIREASEKERLALEVEQLRRQLNERYGFENILGQSQIMHEVFERIRLAAPTSSTVLVSGESGTGKELVARAIHQNSARSGGPFVAVNCAALPAELVESELFGHERGAFTGASVEKQGYFEAASGGTLFVDEISEMPLPLQPKLLRALEQRVVTHVGSTQEIPVDVRIIAATNRDLADAVTQREFRDDLYYRLCVLQIHLPPLRDRRGDIPLLVSEFLKQLNQEHQREVRAVSPEVMAFFQDYGWPGNVRELRNALEAMVILSAKEVLELRDIPRHLHSGARAPLGVDRGNEAGDAVVKPAVAGRNLAELEREAILGTMDMVGGNRTEAARMLGIAVRTVQRKLAEYRGEDSAPGGAAEQPQMRR